MSEPAQLYLRRCNGLPLDGITISRSTVETVLALARAAQGVAAVHITGDLEAGLRIRIPGRRPWEVEAPGTKEREFTYVPLPTGQHRARAAL